VMDIVDGPLCREEFDLIAQAMQDTTHTMFDDRQKFEDIAKNVVRWRYALTVRARGQNILLPCAVLCNIAFSVL
jgi:hypothetical protein